MKYLWLHEIIYIILWNIPFVCRTYVMEYCWCIYVIEKNYVCAKMYVNIYAGKIAYKTGQ